MKKHALEDRDFASWVFIARTRDAIFRNRVKELQKHNLSVRQASVLIVLEELDTKATPAEVSKWVFREPHSVSDFLKRMERDGLIKRIKDLKRKNMIRIEVTDKGREAVHNAKKIEPVHKIMAVLSNEEHRQLMAIMQKLWDKALEELRIENRPIFPSSQ
ncbi:MAG: winged helix DNA-binding protein [Chloroflexi bacterium]|nr:winged helix DNA-binding protein [Chloroflexota bacterium]